MNILLSISFLFIDAVEAALALTVDAVSFDEFADPMTPPGTMNDEKESRPSLTSTQGLREAIASAKENAAGLPREKATQFQFSREGRPVVQAERNRLMRSHKRSGRQSNAPQDQGRTATHSAAKSVAQGDPGGQSDVPQVVPLLNRGASIAPLKLSQVSSHLVSGATMLAEQLLSSSKDALVWILCGLVVVLSMIAVALWYEPTHASGSPRRTTSRRMFNEPSSEDTDTNMMTRQVSVMSTCSSLYPNSDEDDTRSADTSGIDTMSVHQLQARAEVSQAIGTLCSEAASVMTSVDAEDYYKILDAFSEVRQYKVRSNRPAHVAFLQYLGRDDVQEQIQGLFAALSRMSEGKDAVTAEGLMLMCSSFSIDTKDPETETWESTPIFLQEYRWLARGIPESLSYPKFVNVFVLWHAVALEICEIKRATAKEEDHSGRDVKVRIDVPGGGLVYRASFGWKKAHPSRRGSCTFISADRPTIVEYDKDFSSEDHHKDGADPTDGGDEQHPISEQPLYGGAAPNLGV